MAIPGWCTAPVKLNRLKKKAVLCGSFQGIEKGDELKGWALLVDEHGKDAVAPEGHAVEASAMRPHEDAEAAVGPRTRLRLIHLSEMSLKTN